MAITKVSRNLLNTGVSDSSDATAITIDSSERVGIGVTSPDSKLQIANEDGSTYRFGYGGTSDVYFDASSVQFRTDNGGAVNAIMDTDGLKFNGDNAAANALDDYEQGTWTPAVNTGTISVTANSAEYTKIGDMVFAQARINNFSDYTSSNHLILLGLPYSVGTTQSHIGTAWGNFSSPSRTMFFYASGNVYWGGTSYGLALHSNLSSSTDIIISLIYRHG